VRVSTPGETKERGGEGEKERENKERARASDEEINKKLEGEQKGKREGQRVLYKLTVIVLETETPSER